MQLQFYHITTESASVTHAHVFYYYDYLVS